MQTYLITLATAIFLQIIGVLGIFFLLGFVHSKIQKFTHHNYYKTLGWKGILWTAWLGTPIHELGHAFFAKIFRHRIENITIFQPNEASGNLGHVDHSYNPRSLYQKIGNFFIGSAPMIFGSIVLIVCLYLFVPNGKDTFEPLVKSASSILEILKQIPQTLKLFFTIENIKAWNFWLFFYLSLCIASHMAPSLADQKNMWKGFFWIVLVLIIINAITLAIGVDITNYVLNTTRYLGIFTAIFIYAILMSLLHWFISLLLRVLFKR